MPATYTWPLATPPASSESTVPADPGGELRGAGRLGIVGLLTPFVRNGISDFASGGGMALIRSEVEQILGTECTDGDIAGELPWRPEFGSRFYKLRHRNNDRVLEELARAYANEAVSRWLEDVRVVDVVLETFVPAGESSATGRRARVYFEVVGTNGEVLGSGDTAIALPSR